MTARADHNSGKAKPAEALMLQAAEWVRRLLLTLVALAASALPAVAIEPMIARLAEVDDAVKRAAPQFVCTDPTDKATCQQIRHAAAPKGGWYMSEDFAGGQRMRCFSPQCPPTAFAAAAWK